MFWKIRLFRFIKKNVLHMLQNKSIYLTTSQNHFISVSNPQTLQNAFTAFITKLLFKSSAGNWSSKCLKRVWQHWDFLMDLLSKNFRDKKKYGWILNIHPNIRWIQITQRSWLLKRENILNEEQRSAQKRFHDARASAHIQNQTAKSPENISMTLCRPKCIPLELKDC